MTSLRIVIKSCFFSCVNCFEFIITEVFHSCNLQNSTKFWNCYVLRINWIHWQCQLHKQKRSTTLWFSIIIINTHVRISFSMFMFMFLILFSFSIFFTFTLMFFNFFTFMFSIHIIFTAFILCLLADFAHFMIMIKIWSVDEISFIHDDSICSGLFSYLNF